MTTPGKYTIIVERDAPTKEDWEQANIVDRNGDFIKSNAVTVEVTR